MTRHRQEIGQAILDICAGSRTETTLLAQADALAVGIGAIAHMSGMTLAEAEALAAELHKSVVGHIRHNWGRIEFRSEPRQ